LLNKKAAKNHGGREFQNNGTATEKTNSHYSKVCAFLF
jgi:hypothetical protein